MFMQPRLNYASASFLHKYCPCTPGMGKTATHNTAVNGRVYIS